MGSLEASWEYAERFVPEDPVLITARRRADEVGCTPVGPGAGAALRLIASLVGAKSVIELGTGTGVSGVWLLRGMRADGVLTSVDSEAEHQRLARTTFDEAGFAEERDVDRAGADVDERRLARLVPLRARQPTRVRPAAVAVHDDRDVPRHELRRHHGRPGPRGVRRRCHDRPALGGRHSAAADHRHQVRSTRRSERTCRSRCHCR